MSTTQQPITQQPITSQPITSQPMTSQPQPYDLKEAWTHYSRTKPQSNLPMFTYGLTKQKQDQLVNAYNNAVKK